jgi:hypothetical protein
LSIPAIVGIAIGVLAICTLALGIFYWFSRRKRTPENHEHPNVMGLSNSVACGTSGTKEPWKLDFRLDDKAVELPSRLSVAPTPELPG